jgi:hypothetical protein
MKNLSSDGQYSVVQLRAAALSAVLSAAATRERAVRRAAANDRRFWNMVPPFGAGRETPRRVY